MEFKIKDDKKEKHQSFEAKLIQEFDNFEMNGNIVGMVSLTGFGRTKEEAISSLEDEIDTMLIKLELFCNELKYFKKDNSKFSA